MRERIRDMRGELREKERKGERKRQALLCMSLGQNQVDGLPLVISEGLTHLKNVHPRNHLITKSVH